MAKNRPQTKRISNRRASHDYELSDSLIVGMKLTGGETKALRLGRGQLQGSYIAITNGNLSLINATIRLALPVCLSIQPSKPGREFCWLRKVRSNIYSTPSNRAKTIVPIEILTSGKYIKLRLAVGRVENYGTSGKS
jgi:SsrA-binding protein